MRKRRTKEEINEITVYVEKVGLDGWFAMLCRNREQVDVLFDLQEELRERSSVYFHLKNATPKARTKEYEAAIKHKELLAAYLYDSGQLEALATLRGVNIKENEPRVKDFIKRNKKFIREELADLGFSEDDIEELVPMLIEYLQNEELSNYRELGSESLYKQTRRYLSEGKHIGLISDETNNVENFHEKKFRKEIAKLQELDFIKKYST